MIRHTEADLVAFLRQNLATGDQAGAVRDRILLRLGAAGIPRDLAKARSDLAGDWADFAIEPVEEVLYWMGECVALAYGYKITADTPGHRWKAIEAAKLYTEAFLGPVAPMAIEFHEVGKARNARKYTEAPVAKDLVTRWLALVERVWALFEGDFRRRAQARRAL